MQKAENLFGFKKGEKTKQLYVVDSTTNNAFFNKKDRSAVAFHYAKLKDSEKDLSFDLFETAFHESMHLFDYEYKISQGEFKTNFLDLKNKWTPIEVSDEKNTFKFLAFKYLFEYLDERKFLHTYGGHSEEDEEEFLATFINSFNNSHWENEIMKLTNAFRGQYKETLIVLKKRLEKINVLAKNAPIFSEINKKIEFLKQKSPEYSGLADLF